MAVVVVAGIWMAATTRTDSADVRAGDDAPESSAAVTEDDVYDLEEVPQLPPGATAQFDPDDVVTSQQIADDYAADHPEVFSGSFVTGPFYVLGFTENAEEHLAAVRERVPEPSAIRAFRARVSLQELDAIAADITARRSTFAAEGIDVQSVSVEVLHNRVGVGVGHLDDNVRARLVEEYGADNIDVREGGAGT